MAPKNNRKYAPKYDRDDSNPGRYDWKPIDESTGEPVDPLAHFADESKSANQAFRDYAMMGTRRSLRSLLAGYQKQATDQEKPIKPPTLQWSTLAGWSFKYAWQARIKALEAAQYEQDLQRWKKRRDEFRETEYGLAQQLIKKAEEMLQFPVARVTKEEVDGKTVIIVEPAGWNPSDVARYIQLASQLARLATEGELDHPPAGAAADSNLDFSADDLARALQRVKNWEDERFRTVEGRASVVQTQNGNGQNGRFRLNGGTGNPELD